MKYLLLASACLLAVAAGVRADVKGQYVEARTCDVYTGPCFANADTGLAGRHAVLAWKVEQGTVSGAKLDGLGVVAVVATRETLGLKQVLPGKAVLIVDEKATPEQRKALITFAKAQGGVLLEDIVDVRYAPVDLEICECKGNACAKVKAGDAKVETRCLDATHDKACGNETAYYPPLAKGVEAKPALAVEHAFSGKGFDETWRDTERRGAYVGTFSIR
jgi:hypothetical protein